MARPTYTDTLIANNAALVEMNRVLGELEKQFKRTNRITKEANKVSEKANEIALTRGQASSRLVDKLKKEGKELNLISSSLTQTKKNFDTFRDIVGIKGKTGTVIAGMEYLDLLLSSSSQTIKIFGFEAATARKVMYGFLPPGMFRAVNKISTSLRATSAGLRQIAGDGEDANNIFTTLGKGFRKINVSGAFSQMGEKRRRKASIAKIEGNVFRGPTPEESVRLALDKQYLSEKRSPAAKLAEKTKGAFMGANVKMQNIKGLLELQYYKMQRKQFSAQMKFIDYRRRFSKMSNKERIKDIGRIMKKLNPIAGLMKLIKTPLMQMLITGMFYLTGIALVVVLLRKTIWPALKEAFKAVKNNMGMLLLGFKTVFGGIKDVFTGLINGDLMMMIDGILEIGLGLLQVVLGVLWVSAVGLWTLAKEIVVNFFSGVGDFFFKALTDFDFFKKNIGKIALGVVAAIAFFVSLPAALTALGVIIIFRGLKWIWGKIKGLGFLSSGGLANNGMAVVGERGPELVSLPRGSRVHSNSNSRRMNASGTVNNFNITINAKDSSKAEMRRMADEIGRMINSKINRSTSSSTFR